MNNSLLDDDYLLDFDQVIKLKLLIDQIVIAKTIKYPFERNEAFQFFIDTQM